MVYIVYSIEHNKGGRGRDSWRFGRWGTLEITLQRSPNLVSKSEKKLKIKYLKSSWLLYPNRIKLNTK